MPYPRLVVAVGAPLSVGASAASPLERRGVRGLKIVGIVLEMVVVLGPEPAVAAVTHGAGALAMGQSHDVVVHVHVLEHVGSVGTTAAVGLNEHDPVLVAF